MYDVASAVGAGGDSCGQSVRFRVVLVSKFAGSFAVQFAGAYSVGLLLFVTETQCDPPCNNSTQQCVGDPNNNSTRCACLPGLEGAECADPVCAAACLAHGRCEFASGIGSRYTLCYSERAVAGLIGYLVQMRV